MYKETPQMHVRCKGFWRSKPSESNDDSETMGTAHARINCIRFDMDNMDNAAEREWEEVKCKTLFSFSVSFSLCLVSLCLVLCPCTCTRAM